MGRAAGVLKQESADAGHPCHCDLRFEGWIWCGRSSHLCGNVRGDSESCCGAQRLGLSASALSGAFLLNFALAALWLDASLTLVLVLAVVSIRPLPDTLFVVPQAILRHQLRFRQIASVDIIALAVSTAYSWKWPFLVLGRAAL